MNKKLNPEEQLKIEEQLFDYQGDDEVVSSFELKELLDKQSIYEFQIMTTLPTLDYYLGGFVGGELTVVSGPSGNGKTLLCQSFTSQFIKQDYRTVWFSFEVRMEQFIKQFGDDLPLFYAPKTLADKSIKWLYSRIYEAKLKYGCRCVFIDHLHFLVTMGRQNMSTEIGAIMRNLKKMALDLNMTFFLIAHTTKPNPDYEPGLGSARDSSFIEQEADNVFYIWRRNDNPNNSILKIAKNRRCGVMNQKIILTKIGNFLVELEHEN